MCPIVLEVWETCWTNMMWKRDESRKQPLNFQFYEATDKKDKILFLQIRSYFLIMKKKKKHTTHSKTGSCGKHQRKQNPVDHQPIKYFCHPFCFPSQQTETFISFFYKYSEMNLLNFSRKSARNFIILCANLAMSKINWAPLMSNFGIWTSLRGRKLIPKSMLLKISMRNSNKN